MARGLPDRCGRTGGPPPQLVVTGIVGATFEGDKPVRYEFPARCEAVVDVHPRFDVVTLAVISPPNGPAIDLRGLRDDIQAVPRSPANHVALSWWVVVVDRGGATIARHKIASFGCHGYEVYTGGGIRPCGNPERWEGSPPA